MREYSVFDENLDELVAELLAGRQTHRQPTQRFDPDLSYGRHRGPSGQGACRASVVALLYLKRGKWHLPLILRPDSMSTHAGQVSFPGGREDPGETFEQCAVRELYEETGVHPKLVTILGHLRPIFVFASNFQVTPVVAACKSCPEFAPSEAEVKELFEVSLSHILDEGHWQQHRIERGRLQFLTPSIALGRRHIWGATGVILGDLIDLLRSPDKKR